MKRDPYEVLGLKRGATLEEAKVAFRRHAQKWHPDRHGGSKEAEAKFKEIKAAYELLEKEGGAPKEKLSRQDFEDMFEAIFGWGRRSRATSTLNLDIEAAIAGGEKTIHYESFQQCEACGGAGGGTRCPDCGGAGWQQHIFWEHPCERCNGSGRVGGCSACGGSGEARTGKTVKVRIPAGVKDKDELILTDHQGQEILIQIHVPVKNGWTWDGDSLKGGLVVSLWRCLLGGKARVDIPGGTAELEIQEGARPGDVALGVGTVRGVHVKVSARIQVRMPKLTAQERKKVEGWALKEERD